MNMNNREKNTFIRERILSTLLDMMNSQPFYSIIISTLTEKAGVGRASFYRNYTGLEDVLQESDRLTDSSGISFVLSSPEDMQRLIVKMLDFYQSHGDFYMALYRAGLSNIIMDTIIGSFQIDESMPNALAYLLSSMAYSTYGWVIEWMKRGMRESGTELIQMMNSAQKP